MKNEVSTITMNTAKTNIIVIHNGAKHQPHDIIAGLMSFTMHNNPLRIVGHLSISVIRMANRLLCLLEKPLPSV